MAENLHLHLPSTSKQAEHLSSTETLCGTDDLPHMDAINVPETHPSTNHVTKHNTRINKWRQLELNKLIKFPRPVYGRIPNFKGCEETTLKLSQLDDFKKAKAILVGAEKALEYVRHAVLVNAKELYVPMSGVEVGVLKYIKLEDSDIRDDVRHRVSSKGICEYGKEVDVKNLKIDICVVGSVAITTQGFRIGNGTGYFDLQYAILKTMGVICDDTIVISMVHDIQVVDNVPSSNFESHDVPVDIVITPLKILHFDVGSLKPEGIIWNIISQRRLDRMPILKRLRNQDAKNGKMVGLKESDVELKRYTYKRRMYSRKRHNSFNYRSSERTNNTRKASKNTQNREEKQRQMAKEKIPKQNDVDSGIDGKTQTSTDNDSPKISKTHQVPKNRPNVQFSVLIRNIPKATRVRDLKSALIKHNIKPNRIIWRGFKGYCTLQFYKLDVDSSEDDVDKIIASLNNININTSVVEKIVDSVVVSIGPDVEVNRVEFSGEENDKNGSSDDEFSTETN